jgi:hypothetical protein
MTITVVENGSGVDALPSSRHSPPTRDQAFGFYARRNAGHPRSVRTEVPSPTGASGSYRIFRNPLSLLAGALLRLFVDAVNVYGATTVLPWFEAVVAHVTFGIAATGVYKMLSQRQYVDARGAMSER